MHEILHNRVESLKPPQPYGKSVLESPLVRMVPGFPTTFLAKRQYYRCVLR